MTETVILGAIQGITEWLPISSEGAIILAKVNFFRSGLTASKLISFALFLHLGTFLAALIYFRRDIFSIIKGLFNYGKEKEETKKLIRFYVLATLVSGIVGFLIFKIIESIEENLVLAGRGLTLMIGILLLITAFSQFRRKKGYRKIIDLKTVDGFLLGAVQGFSILPGLSRSGLTVSTLLLRKFDKKQALKLSFLMSLPAILGGNIALNLNSFLLNFEFLVGFILTFLLGISTIHLLLKTADKIKFEWFVLFFGLITILSIFI